MVPFYALLYLIVFIYGNVILPAGSGTMEAVPHKTPEFNSDTSEIFSAISEIALVTPVISASITEIAPDVPDAPDAPDAFTSNPEFTSISPAFAFDIQETASSNPEYASAETSESNQDRNRIFVSPDSILHKDLDEVIISAQRTPVRHSDLRRSVMVIERSEIAVSSSQDLTNLLSGVQSVDIRHRGTFGMQSDISIRGGTFDQTLVLLNGVNVTDPQTGHHNLNVPVDLQSIERIEVLHGPGARIFGPDAFNGAVNIITKEPGESQTGGSFTGGQKGLGHGNIRTGFQTGPVSHHLSLSGMRSDGFTDNTDFTSGNVFYRSQFAAESGRFDLQAGYNEKAFGANSFYTPQFPDQYEHTRAGFLSLRWLPDGALRLTPSVYWRRHHDRFELFRHDSPDWYEGHNYHRTDVIGAALNWVHVNRLGTTSAGLDYRYEHIYSNVLGEEMSQPVRVPGYLQAGDPTDDDHAWYTHAYSRSGLSLIVEQSYASGPFSVSGGTLIHTNSDLDAALTLFPGLDLGWQLHDNLRWYASANRTLRLPTFTDLFYSGPDNIGNPDLEPEKAVTVETGLNSSFGGMKADIAVFRRWGRDIIDWVRPEVNERYVFASADEQMRGHNNNVHIIADENIWRSDNLTDVTITGFEAGISVPVTRLLGGENSGPNRRLRVQYTYLHADKHSGDVISNYALDHLSHKLDIRLNVPFTGSNGFTAKISWQDRAGGYLLYEDGDFTGTQPFDSFWLTDLSAYQHIGRFRLFGNVTNVFDTRYVDIANVPQPGRWVSAGFDFEL